MELSEAIRIGSKMHPQAYGYLKFTRMVQVDTAPWIPQNSPVRLSRTEERSETCALGAAMEGSGMGAKNQWTIPGTAFATMFPIVLGTAPCPYQGCGILGTFVQNVIMHLNDNHRWSREAIAMWVETLEKARDEKAAHVLAPAVPLLSYEPVTVA